ncbi:MAG TPA: NYN domain-containing protein [Thermomicrobiales bacterium]|nr:NYN domain-containing protein [Thermomicrobiales bacterium]
MPARRDESDRVAIFFDMSNLYFAAKDMGIRIDYARLLDFLVGDRRLQRAYAYIGVSPDDENSHSFITWLSRNGFRVRTKVLRRYEDGTTKANLDMELAIDLLTQARYIDVAIIVSGDGDFVSLVDAAQRGGLRVEVAATPRQTSTDLIDVSDRFIDLEANARIYARAELPPRSYGHTTGTLGRGLGRPAFATGALGEGRTPYGPREGAEGAEAQRGFEPHRPYPAQPGAAPQQATSPDEEAEEDDEPQPSTSDPRLMRRPPTTR